MTNDDLVIKFSCSQEEDRIVEDPIISKIRILAKSQKWTGIDGFKEFIKIEYDAVLRTGKYLNFTSIKFHSIESKMRFISDMDEIDLSQYTSVNS